MSTNKARETVSDDAPGEERVNTLLKSEERFRLLVESVRDYAIFMLDPQGRVVSWNSGAELIKGYTAQEILGRHFSIFYPEEKVQAGWPAQELEVARSEGRFEDEGWRVRKDGSRFWANVVITTLFDEKGALQGFAKITRDLTQRRRMEVLEESGRRMNEFLAMLAHELRNPLAPMSNVVQLLLSSKGDWKLVEWSSKVLDRQVKQLNRLVTDLLDTNRITSGKISLTRRIIDVRKIIELAAESSRPMIEMRRQAFHIDLPGEPVAVDGDAERLLQVVSNLIGNAAKFTPAGGKIECKVARDAEFAAIRVRDDGVGMSPELLAVVFEPFTQGAQSLDRTDAGLGLAVVKQIVQLHGGSVRASSAGEGRGSEFLVSLPLGDPEAIVEDAIATGLEHLDRATGFRILIVDDNRDSADSMATALRMFGHEVLVAYDSASALALVSGFAPDAALLDIGLPVIDGYELARKLKASPRGTHVAVFAITGYGRDDDRLRAAAAGFERYFVKPVDFAELAAAIEAHCVSR